MAARPAELTRAVRFAVTAVLAAAGTAAVLAPDAEARPRPRGYPADGVSRDAAYEGTAPYFVFEGDWWEGGAPPRGRVRTVDATGPARVMVGPYLTTVHVDVPAGSAVQVVVRRLGGSLPAILWVYDAEGRAWTPGGSYGPRTFETEPIPAVAEGGLDVVLTPTRTRRALVEVSVREVVVDPAGTVAGTPWVPGQVIVPAADVADPQALADELGVEVIDVGDGYYVFGTPGGRSGLEWLDAAWMTDEAMNHLPGAAGGFEPDSYAEPPETSQTNQAIVGSEFGRMYSRQAALRTVNAAPVPRGPRGEGMVVAVLDTGVDASHPLFSGRIAPGGTDLVDGDDDPSEERDEVDDDRDGRVDEGFGHGTVVAGIALAIAPQARILPVRVLDDEGLGTASRVAEGVRWAKDHGAHVINLSLGTRSTSRVLSDAVAEAVAAGILVVVAAGNDGDRWAVDSPADVPGSIAVTALNVRGRRAGWANGNRYTAIAAPGVHVIGPYPGGTWALCRGTSFAAPFASGAAALLREEASEDVPAWLPDAVSFRELLAPRARLDLRPLWR